jgi:hypothetical protein
VGEFGGSSPPCDGEDFARCVGGGFLKIAVGANLFGGQVKMPDVCLQVAGSAKRERLVLEHRPGVIQAWAEQLRERFGSTPLAVSVELSRGPVVSALLEHDFFRLFPVQPTTVANYRKAFAASGAKDDPTTSWRCRSVTHTPAQARRPDLLIRLADHLRA